MATAHHNSPRTLRFVVFRQADRWVAHGLEIHIAISAADRDELPARLRSQLLGQIAADRRRGAQPFSAFKRAPERYWRMFEAAEPLCTEILTPPWWIRVWNLLRRESPDRREIWLAAAPSAA